MNATHPFLFSSRRLKFAQRQFVAATLAGMCFAHGAIACDAETLIAFEGQWAGQGQVITESNTNEPIACRLVFQRSPEGPLITNGKCATLAQTLPVTGYLQCQGGALIGPLLKLQGGPDPEFVEDASQGDHIQLVLKGPHPETGAPVRYQLSALFNGSEQIDLSISRHGMSVFSMVLERETE